MDKLESGMATFRYLDEEYIVEIKLVLKNFRSFKEETRFDLLLKMKKYSINRQGNGAGKTSIFEAIKLCIYGPLAYRYGDLFQTMIENQIYN